MGRAAYRRALDQLQGLSLPEQEDLPTQEDTDAQATGDAYRAMSNAQADAIESRARDEGPGGRVYAAGDIPPPESQRQRVMDRDEQRVGAAVAGFERGNVAPTADRLRPTWMGPDDPRAPAVLADFQRTMDEQRRVDAAVQGFNRANQAPTADRLRPSYMESSDPRAALDDQVAQRITPSQPSPSPKASKPAGDAPPIQAQSPAGGDHTGADWFDVLFAPFQAIGAGLAAAGGRPAPQMVSLGAQERRADAARQAAEQERNDEERMAKTRLGMQQDQLAAQVQGREQNAALQREGMDRADARSAAALDQRARLAAQDPRHEQIRAAAEEQRQMRDPASAVSQAWRDQVRTRFEMLPPQLRGSVTPERFDAMTGEQLREFARGLPRVSGGVRTSGAGGGGGARSTQDADGVIADAIAAGIPERTARAMYANPRTRAQLMQRIATHPGASSGSAPGANIDDDALYQEALRQGFPPVSAREMIADPDERARLRRQLGGAGIAARRADQAAGNDRDVAIAAAQDSVRALEEALPPEGQDIPGVGRFDSLRGGGFFQSQEGVRLRNLAQNAVRRYLRLESGAAISDQEMESEMALRGLGPGATERQFRDGLRDLQRDLAVRAQRRERGSSMQPPTQTPRPQQPASGDTVTLTLDGQRRQVPRARLQAILARAREAGDQDVVRQIEGMR